MATLERSQEVSVAQLLSEKRIVSDLSADSRDGVFEELVDLLEDCDDISDSETALADIRDREDILSTGIGNGVAIPHAKTQAVDELVAAFARVPDGVDFKSLDGKPARLIFLLLSPEEEAGLHVRALARISRLLKNAEFRKHMMEASDAAAIYKHIEDGEQV